jgi:hypothetical protein
MNVLYCKGLRQSPARTARLSKPITRVKFHCNFKYHLRFLTVFEMTDLVFVFTSENCMHTCNLKLASYILPASRTALLSKPIMRVKFHCNFKYHLRFLTVFEMTDLAFVFTSENCMHTCNLKLASYILPASRTALLSKPLRGSNAIVTLSIT